MMQDETIVPLRLAECEIHEIFYRIIYREEL